MAEILSQVAEVLSYQKPIKLISHDVEKVKWNSKDRLDHCALHLSSLGLVSRGDASFNSNEDRSPQQDYTIVL